ncbi:uncharacterized protein TNIN_185781 [Trichonephila inaurata madagascariensis]|uniref:Uncharacterized protein n=1 Tax=Trichonephila inaurata madagascariensis TaxID=2747483 RepID=A0A8X6X228_9ARAC|nr:uncharacterized protein TNIN_185781 [Trichonephila inaurata madagascariensis]
MALGAYCKALGIDEEVLSGQKSKVCETKTISNGVMWELKKYKTAKKLTTKDIIDWLIKIFQVKCENTEAVQEKLDKKFETLVGFRSTITRSPHKYRGELERLMNYNFDFPEEMGLDPVSPFEPTVCANLGPKLLKVLKEKGGDDDDSVDMSGHSDDDDEQAKKRKAREEIIQLKKDLGSARKVITSLNDKMNDLNKRCQILNDLSKSSVSERRRIESDIGKLKNEWNAVMITWHDCMERLNHVNNNKGNYLDVGYMVRRNKTKQGIFDELSFEFEKTLEDFRYKLNYMIEKERRKKKVVSREYRQKSKTDRKRVRQESDDNEESKKPCLSEEANKQTPAPSPPTSISVDEFMKSEKVDEFKGGKYVNALRAIFVELTSMPFPCNNVHDIIYSILDELEPLNVDKIPSPSFAGNIFMEARMAVALQAFSDLLSMNKVSICNDGTTKFALQDATYDVTLADETNLKLSVKDISKGSPDTSLSMLKDLLSEIMNTKVEGNQLYDAYIKKAKSFLTEHDLLDKKIIEILFLYKQQLTPIVADNLDGLSDAFRNKVVLLNNHCTGLYFLLGLSKLTDFTVLAWESMSFGCNVDALKDMKNDLILSKTVQQMYTFCSIVDPEASDNKISVEFKDFLLKVKKLDTLPLAPYKGNLFNVIFHNSAGIWFYHETGILTEFFEEMKKKEFDASPLSDILSEKHSFAFAKALGLLGKLVAVPLWTVLEDDEVQIGLRYNSLLKNVENWSKDASKFMRGQERLFEDVPVSHDAVYVSLIKDNEANDALTKELLELLFTAFVPYVKFFLCGNAISEENGETAMEVDSDLKKAIHEDFATFDRITINIHSVATYAQDALTLYSKARNGEWQDKLCSKDNLKVFEFVEKDYNKHLKTHYKRKIKLYEAAHQGQNAEKNNSYQVIEKKYKLIDDLIKWGGLWKSEKEIDAQIKDMKESDQLNALRAQIRFRRHILGEEHENGLLDLASEGECFNATMLLEHLKTILKKECKLTETNAELATATDDEQKRQEITELCNNAQELKATAEQEKSTVPKENFHWLLGKLISHTATFDQGQECITGVCIARKNLSGVCAYFIRYKGKGVYKVPEVRIAEDFKNQNLKVIDPSVNDLIGSRLSRAFIKDDGDLEWLDCKVVGVTGHGSDFVLEFDFYGANAQVEEDVNIPELETFTFATRLLEEYRTDHLRLL